MSQRDKFNQLDKQNKFIRRKYIKSPFKIRDKIRELEEKLGKHSNSKDLLRRHRSGQGHVIPNNQNNLRRQNAIIPRTLQVPTIYHTLQRSQSNKILTSERQKATGRQQQQLHLNHENVQRMRRQSSNNIPGRLNSQQQSLNKLKRQNDKYKKIYSSSAEKMQNLQKKLKQIKQQHLSQKIVLENIIGDLKKKIDQRKINIGHLYSYDDKGNNFLIVHDKIITQTDNQNSSSNVEHSKQHKTPGLSNLSIQSRKAQ